MSNISASFKSLSHPIRVQILLLLAEQLNNGYQFTDLSHDLQIESSSKLSFHIEKLHDFIDQDIDGRYHLNTNGKKAVDAIHLLGIEGRDQKDLEQVLSESPVTVEVHTDEPQKTADALSTPYHFGLIFLGTFFYFLLIVVGLPVVSLIVILSTTQQPSPTIFFVPLILFVILSITLGMVLYLLVEREHHPLAWRDMGFFTLLISYSSALVSGILLIGPGVILFFPLVEFCFLTIGIYLIAQFRSSAAWSTRYLVPSGLVNNRKIIAGLGLLTLLSLPFYQHEIITHIDSRLTNGAGMITGSSSTLISSSQIGIQGLSGFAITIFLITLFLLFNGRKPIRSRYFKLYFSLVLAIQLLSLLLSQQFDVLTTAIDIQARDGWMWVIMDTLGFFSYLFGIFLAIMYYHYQFDESLAEIS